MSDTDSASSIRPTKKQRELLTFIEKFIAEHGYSPSYREIMNGLNYTSVATVALHVNSLIRRGHLRKRDRSARSLEVVSTVDGVTEQTAANPVGETWMVDKVEQFFKRAEAGEFLVAATELEVLVGSLKILGLHDAAAKYELRLQTLAEKQGAAA